MMCLLVLACPRPFRRMSIIDNASWFSGFWHCWPHCWATRPGGEKWLWWVPAIADSISSLSAGIGARLSNISHKVTAYTSVRRTALYHDRSTQVYAAKMQHIKRELPKWRLLAVKTSKPKIAYSTTTYNKGPNLYIWLQYMFFLACYFPFSLVSLYRLPGFLCFLDFLGNYTVFFLHVPSISCILPRFWAFFIFTAFYCFAATLPLSPAPVFWSVFCLDSSLVYTGVTLGFQLLLLLLCIRSWLGWHSRINFLFLSLVSVAFLSKS